jgi:hypothetical protein
VRPPANLRPKRVKVALRPLCEQRHTIARSLCLIQTVAMYVPELFTPATARDQHIIHRICFVFHPSMPSLKLVCIQAGCRLCMYADAIKQVPRLTWSCGVASDYEEYVDCSSCVPVNCFEGCIGDATNSALRSCVREPGPVSKRLFQASPPEAYNIQCKVGDSIRSKKGPEQ